MLPSPPPDTGALTRRLVALLEKLTVESVRAGSVNIAEAEIAKPKFSSAKLKSPEKKIGVTSLKYTLNNSPLYHNRFNHHIILTHTLSHNEHILPIYSPSCNTSYQYALSTEMRFQWTDGIAARCLGSDIRTKSWSGGEADVITKHQFVTAKGLVVALNVTSNDYLRGPSRNPWYAPLNAHTPLYTLFCIFLALYYFMNASQKSSLYPIIHLLDILYQQFHHHQV